MCGIMSLFRQFEPTETKLPAEPPTAPSTPKSNTSGEVAQFRQFKSNGSGKSKTILTNNNTKDTEKKNKKTRRSTISILLNKNTRTFQGVTLAKALAWNAKKRVQKKMSREKLRERYEKNKAKKNKAKKNKATLIQKRVRGMLVRMKEQKKKKISTKTVDQLMLRRSRARSLLGAEQEDTLIGKISTKKISTKTVDQLMLRRPGAKSLLGTVPVKSKHSRIEEVDRLMRLRPETPALVALGKSGGIRRNIAKIDSMMAKIKKTPDNDVRSRFSIGQSVVSWENNRWVPRTIVGWDNSEERWQLRSQIPELGGDLVSTNDDDLMPMTYVEESLASILKIKLDEINETMERIGKEQINGFRITMETISKLIRKSMDIDHNEILNMFQTSIQSLEARLTQLQRAALNHN